MESGRLGYLSSNKKIRALHVPFPAHLSTHSPKTKTGTCQGTFRVKWLGRKDSNPRMAGPEPAALPLGDCPAKELVVYALAGQGGFEPPDGGTKTRCLTAWRLPSA